MRHRSSSAEASVTVTADCRRESFTAVSALLDSPGSVTRAVYNILGQRVRTLVNETRYAGEFNVACDWVNDAGLPVSSGVYLYRLDARPAGGTGEPRLLIKKMMVMR